MPRPHNCPLTLPPSLILVEYWRRRYQRMNPESFVAANVMALVTHTVVRNVD